LLFFFGSAFTLSIFKLLPYTPVDLVASLLIILAVSFVFNVIFSFVFEAPTNTESIYITSLILFFLITPAQGGVYAQFLPLAIWASIWAMASKYIFAIGKKHIFNPAAFAMVLVAFTINESASWWIGTPYMLPFVVVGGLLLVRKIRRADLVFSFIISSLVFITIFAIFRGSNVTNTLFFTFRDSAFLFFAFIMLTEPLTAPTTKWLRIAYGILVGFLFTPSLHIGAFYATPELALVVGNVFAYMTGPKEKLFLKLKERVKVGADTFDFIFQKDKSFSF